MVKIYIRILTLVGLIFGTFFPSILLANSLAESKWEMIRELSDEFKGHKLDATKWHDHNPTWLGREPGFFSKKNVTVSEGKLHLTAKMEEVPNLPKMYHTYTTAAVKSKAKVLYGFFEIKCKPMDSRASSAFWFYSQDPDKNNTKHWTEIDVFEISGKSPERERVYHMSVHVFVTPEDGEKHWKKSEKWTAPFRLADDYHLYALEWDKKKIRWYVDGKVVRTVKNTHWHQPLHMNFDSETFSTWFGLPKKENLPSTFSIEYIRSWKKVEKK